MQCWLLREIHNKLHFTIEGPGEIVATDNGDPTDMTEFPSHMRKAFSGMALCIIKGQQGMPGVITLKVSNVCSFFFCCNQLNLEVYFYQTPVSFSVGRRLLTKIADYVEC